jgi:hypothetical protein
MKETNIRALSWSEVNRVVDRLSTLNPFGGVLAGQSVLKVEDENFDESGAQRELWCLTIASKRYGLAIRDENGYRVLVGEPSRAKRSEHGLGHLLSPEDRDPNSEDRRWCDRWWVMLFCQAWGLAYEEPEWFDHPAVGRLTVTSAPEERAFRSYNAAKRRYRDKVRPWNFLMVAYPTHLERKRQRLANRAMRVRLSATIRSLTSMPR